MTPRFRTLGLTVHVATSVGWLGAVAAFFVLSVAGLTTSSVAMIRAAHLSMACVGWWAIVPLCIASVLTGIIQSLGTPWGMFRHYWVLLKLIGTIVATILLIVHMQPTEQLAHAALSPTFPANYASMQHQLAIDAGAALGFLIVMLALSMYKPPGLTPYGWRKRRLMRILPKPRCAAHANEVT